MKKNSFALTANCGKIKKTGRYPSLRNFTGMVFLHGILLNVFSKAAWSREDRDGRYN